MVVVELRISAAAIPVLRSRWAVRFGRRSCPAERQVAGASDVPAARARPMGEPHCPNAKCIFLCAADWRAVPFKVKTRLCNGEPSLSHIRRIRLMESHFGKNLAEMSIICGQHCRIPSLKVPH